MKGSGSGGRPQRFATNRLALKIALITASAATVGLGGLYLGGVLQPAWSVGAAFLIVAGAAYAAAHGLLNRRLTLAHAILKQIRRHQFENLEAAHQPKGDELNGLIWQVYRTGLTLEKEIQELRKVENYRREFLGNVSHELKTPIFAIQGFAETLLDGALDDARVNRPFVEKILRNAGRLANLTRDLSEISRLETGELQIRVGSFDLGRLVHEVIESLELSARTRDVTVRFQGAPALPRVQGDRERIRQVLINLVDNAIKYNDPGGAVEVVARVEPSGEMKVAVVDDGIGIAPQDIPRLTERFYRVDRSRSRAEGGTGLGLAIVKHILAAHGRQLVVDSTLNQGSTFGFTLPTVPPDERAWRPVG